MERRRLSLKKPAIIAGLVLTLMMTALVGMSMTAAHAAPAPGNTGTGVHSLAARTVLLQAMKKTKSTTCSYSAKFYVDPCTVRRTANGQIIVTLIGQKLNPSSSYSLYADAIDSDCGSTITNTSESTDEFGNFNATFTAPDCLAPGTYYIELQNDFSPYNVYTTKLVIK